ncbi:MAG: alpha/beta fold hydrolase [Gemmatimonadales bacterium]
MRCQKVAAVLAIGLGLAVATTAQAQANPWGAGAGKGKGAGRTADVNGIKLYYELHGSGRPLILLHGGLGAIEMFGPNLPRSPLAGRSSPSICTATGARPTSIDHSASR